jgi:glycine cleavage system H protein
MNIPQDLLYTKDHEWARVQGDIAVIGISDHAQHALGDITFIELPKVGAPAKQFGLLGSVESVKAASDIYAPFSGTIVEVNTILDTTPGLINQNCYTDGWIAKIKISNPTEKSGLKTPADYAEHLKGLEH